MDELELVETAPGTGESLSGDRAPQRRRRRSASAVEGDDSSSETKRTYTRRAKFDFDAMQSELSAALGLTGQVMSMAVPVTGMTLIMRSQMASKALIDIARDDPKFAAALSKLLRGSKYAALGQVGFSIAIAAAVDMRMVKPDGGLPQAVIGDVLEKFQTAPPETPARPTVVNEDIS